MATSTLDLNAEELGPQGESTPEGEEDAPEYRLGVLAGCEYSPEPNAKLNDVQKNAFKDLCTKAAKRDYPARLIEVIQSWEKLEVSTPIATPGGWKTMGTLVSGDYVFGSNGRIVNVTAIQPITKEESYSILFDDGSNIVASADHTWNTQTLKERGAGKPAVERSTKELFNTQYRTHSIDLSPGLQTFDIELPIDPYLFGCWLGDGITSNGYVCGNRDDLAIVVQHFRDAGYMVSGPTKDGGKNSTVKNCQKVWVHGLARTIRSLKLGDKKRIPRIFLRASLSQRIALLQGLMDTDGWADGSGGCGWGQSPDKHSELIADFSELLSSLGVKHQFYPYSREHDGKTFNFHQTSFRPSFAAFRLKRKLASQKIPKENGRTRKVYIQKIEPVGERTVRCISVDAPDHLYLAGKSMIPTHNCALFYRGFQFLIPLRGGGWQVPGESTGYGPSMQMDLALLPTNIYSAQAQILISTLTRAIPTVRFEPQDGANDAEITAAESAEKFIKVIERNIDLMMVQNDAARYLYTDGRAVYWSRFEKDGQRFGWEEDDRPDDIVPENEPAQLPAESGQGGIPGLSPEGEEGPEVETPAAPTAGAPPEGSPEEEQAESPEEEAAEQPTKQPRTPRGQEVRTAHGKLEFKLIPMSANDLQGCDAVQYETEVDVSRAKGMFPWVADDIKGGSMGQSEGEIARLARQNVKLGMQSTYITSDSVADDVTIQRTWFRPSYFTHISDKQVRTSIISEFPDGALVVYAGETFCYARNESMEQSLALMQAFSGDGQNRNALGTSMMPIQKRVNNWLDLLNDSFIRTVPKKWMDSKAFDVNALKKQTNIPGDIGSFKRQPGVQVSELCWVEPQVTVSPTLAMFVKEYIGPISELMSGAYPALAGSSDLGGNDLMDVDELIPTPSGFVRNGDLNDGDTIFGQDGKHYRIEKAHEAKTKQCFKVTFDDDTFTRVHDGHLWTTFSRDERVSLRRRTASRAKIAAGCSQAHWPPTSKAPITEGTVRRTDEILATLKIDKFGGSNHSIRIAAPIDMPDRELPIDPYCLGAWLGDGSASGGIFTCNDDDALPIMFQFHEAGFPSKKCKAPYLWSISKLAPRLKAMGLIENKHIPKEYFWASISQRLALLQGLMDTDGCATQDGKQVFVNTDRNLADGVYQLAASLGLKPFFGMQLSVPIFNKRLNRWYGGGVPTYRVRWASSMPVFRLDRKLARIRSKSRETQGWRYIKSIELDGERTMRCLTTSNPTGLYLFGRNFNVTHNTKGGIEIQRNQALGRLGPTWHSIQNAEATSMRQLVMWGAKCRDKSINERIPGGRPVELEVNDLRANILCFAETDESFPENHADKKAQLIEVFEDSAKTPQLQEVLYNASNLEFLQSVYGLSDLYIPQVASRNKQLGEFEILLKSAPVPNPKLQQAQAVVQQLATMGADPQKLQMLGQNIQNIPPEVSSIPIDSAVEDSETEAATCWQYLTSPEGRKAKRLNPPGYSNLRLHFLEHTQDAMAKKQAAGPDKVKPPAESINLKDLPPKGAVQLAGKGGIQLTEADFTEQKAEDAALKTAKQPPPAKEPEHVGLPTA